jgi:hypothetical protein
MTHFDDAGDLWIDIAVSQISAEMNLKVSLMSRVEMDPRNPGQYYAVTEMNLTDYIRRVIADSKE